MMYKAFVLGHGRQYKAETLDLLLHILACDRYRIKPVEQVHVQKRLAVERRMIIPADRSLTHSEVIREHFRKPHIPLTRLDQKEEVQVRFEYYTGLSLKITCFSSRPGL